jgi:lysophospholipase L1-like esterase
MEHRGLVIRFVVPVIAVLITLLALEIALRGYHAAKRPAAANVNQLAPTPLHIVLDAPYLYGLNPKHPDISSQGTRDDEVLIPKPKGTFRVLVLGDSIAYGSSIPKDKTFPNRLESLLREHVGSAEVINAGVSGYSAYNELQYYLARGKEFEPDIVVVAFCMNDVVNPRLHWGDAPGVRIPDEAIPNHDYDVNHVLPLMQKIQEQKTHTQPAKVSVLEHSELYRALAPRLSRLFAPNVDSDAKVPTYITGEDTISIEVLVDKSTPESKWLRSIYDRLHAAVEAKGAKLVIALFPLAYQVDANYPFMPQEQIGEYCEQNSIPCLDLLPAFRQHRKEDIFLLNNSPFYDIWHLTEAGHDLSAREIERFLRENKLLPATE